MPLQAGSGKAHALVWPITPEQWEAVDDMLTALFKKVKTPPAAGGTVTPYPGDGSLQAVTGLHALTKAATGAFVLGIPDTDGIAMDIISRTAFPHVITTAGLVDDGVTGGSKNTMTFAAFAGAGIRIVSYDGKWNVVAKNVVTVT